MTRNIANPSFQTTNDYVSTISDTKTFNRRRISNNFKDIDYNLDG